jgi:hypothetical protein
LAIIEDQLHSSMLHLVLSVLKLGLLLCCMVHIIACIWYAIGDATNGWITYYGAHVQTPEKDSIVFWYSASCRWTLAQINGRTDMDERRNMPELIYTCTVAIAFAVIFMSLFISGLTAVMMEMSALTQSKTSLQRMVSNYLQKRDVSSRLVGNVKNCLAQDMDSSDWLEEEAKVLSSLPQQLARDMLHEVRAKVFLTYFWFAAMNDQYPRAVRHLCCDASHLLCPHMGEIVFEKGDACKRMLFVEQNTVLYARLSDEEILDLDSTPPARGLYKSATMNLVSKKTVSLESKDESIRLSRKTSEEGVAGVVLQRGDWLSEAVLWVDWINAGRLVAGPSTCLVALYASDFAATLQDYRGAYALSVLFARQFAESLKSMRDISDLSIQQITAT